MKVILVSATALLLSSCAGIPHISARFTTPPIVIVKRPARHIIVREPYHRRPVHVIHRPKIIKIHPMKMKPVLPLRERRHRRRIRKERKEQRRQLKGTQFSRVRGDFFKMSRPRNEH